ncbi:ribonuclease III [soil metagenome]
MPKFNIKNKNLLEQALTHRSWVNENIGKRNSNERLEFLGDAVLELVVTDHLYKEFPDKPEGYLTALRANIVNTVNLAAFAKKIELGETIFLSKGELKSGKISDSLLADTVEAVIGAIHIDQGYEAASKFILENLLSDLDEKLKAPLKDAKSMLQETIQAKKNSAPKYNVVKIIGPDHAKEFTVEVKVDEKILGTGTGKSKNEAEQNAASLALKAVTG